MSAIEKNILTRTRDISLCTTEELLAYLTVILHSTTYSSPDRTFDLEVIGNFLTMQCREGEITSVTMEVGLKLVNQLKVRKNEKLAVHRILDHVVGVLTEDEPQSGNGNGKGY